MTGADIADVGSNGALLLQAFVAASTALADEPMSLREAESRSEKFINSDKAF